MVTGSSRGIDRARKLEELEDHGCESDKLPVNSKLVWHMLLQLDPYKSMEADGIHPRVLKELVHGTEGPLSMIFKWFWESEEVPFDWKMMNIVPVFKKGNKRKLQTCQLHFSAW
ncbi:RNA-directed DNA polymerase from mobile element jockey [Pitangus sulphuratus]|nr:RNA-directed DNA polymerase from mobile element jockey [Pitangus sulphuratus]